MKVKVRVPATTANLGPGFDALGMALALYNYVEAEEVPSGIRVEVRGEGSGRLPEAPDNLVVRAMFRLFDKVGYAPSGLCVRLENHIPIARGLGSSAAAIVGGLVSANYLAGSPLNQQQLLDLAAEMEGHPDNVSAALLGGFVISTREGQSVRYMRLEPPFGIETIVVIPQRELKTQDARRVLPKAVSLEDAVFNISRACALVGSLMTGEYEALDWATEDRLHQQYRDALAPELRALLKEARAAGARGAVLSGAGPSVLVFADRNRDLIKQRMKEVLNSKGMECTVLDLHVDLDGARVVQGIDPGRSLVVMKFGGTSVDGRERIFRAAEKVVRKRREGNDVVVVVSAMGDTTDQLLELAWSVASNPNKRELDVVLSTGELVSSALMCMAIQELGCEAVSMSGAQAGIITDGTYTKARIVRIDTRKLLEQLRAGKVVVVAGYQGVCNGDVTTLGRGGSDTSAVALAAALGAGRCEIYTDVDGVYSADPRVEPQASHIDRISYDEMIEMANLGARVMQPRSVELGRKYGVEIVVLSSFEDKPGTVIGEVQTEVMEGPLVRAVTHSVDQVKVVLKGVPDVPGVAARVFRRLSQAAVNVDMIVQSLSRGAVNDIAFTVSHEDKATAITVCKQLKEELGAEDLVVDDNVAKVSLVGAGIWQDASIAADMFEALAGQGINIDMISTSGTRISCLIQRSKVEPAVRALHSKFRLSNGNRQ
ncbi:MAG: aspartate kinase [Bacillota bacterium]